MAGKRGQVMPRLVATCAAVGVAMKPATAPWWIIASAAIALHGADAGPVGDVDVLMDAADAQQFCTDYGIAIGAGLPDGRFRSALFARWHAHPLPVEIMAGFALLTPRGWQTIWPATRQAVALEGGGTVYVPDRTELTALLRAFGRPKDLQRAAALEA